MFFIISKLLSFLLYPIVWVILLMLGGLIVKKQELKRRLLWTSVGCLLFFSNPFIFDECMRLWEVEAVGPNTLPEFKMGIVLGTTSSYDAKLDRIQFYGTADRLFQAIELYKLGKIKCIVYSGGSGSLYHQEEKEGPWVKRYLERIGIAPHDIFMEYNSRNTHENAVFTYNNLPDSLRNSSGLLITSGYHMRRALGCFKKEHFDVIPYTTQRSSGPRKFDPEHLFMPHAHVLEGWAALLHEWMGTLVYYLKGYI